MLNCKKNLKKWTYGWCTFWAWPWRTILKPYKKRFKIIKKAVKTSKKKRRNRKIHTESLEPDNFALNCNVLQQNNLFLSKILSYRYKSSRAIKRKDFSDNPRYLFQPNYGNYMHISALILSVFKEFIAKWWNFCIHMANFASFSFLSWNWCLSVFLKNSEF